MAVSSCASQAITTAGRSWTLGNDHSIEPAQKLSASTLLVVGLRDGSATEEFYRKGSIFKGVAHLQIQPRGIHTDDLAFSTLSNTHCPLI
jgi:hypothetical protein